MEMFARTWKEDNNMSNFTIKNPIFIIGAPRSGTSILGRILENHPNLVHVREPRLIWKFGNDGKSDLLSAVDTSPRIKAHIRKKFDEFIIRDGQRLLEKTPSNSLRVSFINEVFPDAKFVHIIRNGYDSAASIRSFWEKKTTDINYTRLESGENILIQRLKEMHWTQAPYYAKEFIGRFAGKMGIKTTVFWGPRLPEMKRLHRELDLIELCALQWKTCVEKACEEGRKLPADKYKEVRLEGLNWEAIDSIMSFLDLSPSQEVETYFSEKFDPKIIQKPKIIRNETEHESITKVIAPTMEWLGYSVSSS